MKKEIFAGFVLVTIVFVAGYFALGFNVIHNNQNELSEVSDNANLQTCKDIRKSVCLTSDEVTDSDYPRKLLQQRTKYTGELVPVSKLNFSLFILYVINGVFLLADEGFF